MAMRTFILVGIVVCLLALPACPAFADCSAEQNTENSDTGSRTMNGQSFTAPCTGKLNAIAVTVAAGSS